MELFDTMDVRDNVALGREALLAGTRMTGRLVGLRHERAECREAADAALDRCGISHLARHTVGDLSTGQRRLVELARALASGFRFLLLDEPSSGLDPSETEQFGAVLRTLVEERGVGILLVEHDMALVMSVCQYLYVLDFGVLIAEGSPHQVQANPVVRAAYLGDDVGVGDDIGLEVGRR
jgi:ABC-type branched-subunit amino acid transport system ATPase component